MTGEIKQQPVVHTMPVAVDEIVERGLQFFIIRIFHRHHIKSLSFQGTADQADIPLHAGKVRPAVGVVADTDDKRMALPVQADLFAVRVLNGHHLDAPLIRKSRCGREKTRYKKDRND